MFGIGKKNELFVLINVLLLEFLLELLLELYYTIREWKLDFFYPRTENLNLFFN